MVAAHSRPVHGVLVEVHWLDVVLVIVFVVQHSLVSVIVVVLHLMGVVRLNTSRLNNIMVVRGLVVMEVFMVGCADNMLVVMNVGVLVVVNDWLDVAVIVDEVAFLGLIVVWLVVVHFFHVVINRLVVNHWDVVLLNVMHNNWLVDDVVDIFMVHGGVLMNNVMMWLVVELFMVHVFIVVDGSVRVGQVVVMLSVACLRVISWVVSVLVSLELLHPADGVRVMAGVVRFVERVSLTVLGVVGDHLVMSVGHIVMDGGVVDIVVDDWVLDVGVVVDGSMGIVVDDRVCVVVDRGMGVVVDGSMGLVNSMTPVLGCSAMMTGPVLILMDISLMGLLLSGVEVLLPVVLMVAPVVVLLLALVVVVMAQPVPLESIGVLDVVVRLLSTVVVVVVVARVHLLVHHVGVVVVVMPHSLVVPASVVEVLPGWRLVLAVIVIPLSLVMLLMSVVLLDSVLISIEMTVIVVLELYGSSDVGPVALVVVDWVHVSVVLSNNILVDSDGVATVVVSVDIFVIDGHSSVHILVVILIKVMELLEGTLVVEVNPGSSLVVVGRHNVLVHLMVDVQGGSLMMLLVMRPVVLIVEMHDGLIVM